MQKIDVTPSVEMLRACFRTGRYFRVSFKGGIKIEASPTVGDPGWALSRLKHGEETSYLVLGFDKAESGHDLFVECDEPIVKELAKGIWAYRKPEDPLEAYLAQFVTVYGGKTSDITSVER